MIVLFDALAEHLESSISGLPVVQLSLLDVPKTGVAIQFIPAPEGARYMDRGRQLNVQYQVLTKGVGGAGNAQALNWVTRIAELLELSNGELEVTGYDFIKNETYTEPNFVEKNEAGEYIYTALFRCELIKRG